MHHSAVLIIPAALKPQADAAGEAMGWGATTYTIPLGDGVGITHWAARADVPEHVIATLRGGGDMPAGDGAHDQDLRNVLSALIADFSPDPEDEGAPADLWGRAHLDAVLARHGLLRHGGA